VIDRFDTSRRRTTVLAAWRDSPTRFREDANAEEDLVLGGYADRLLVELLQNAADAAARAGVSGIVRIRLTERELRVANTGARLDAAGVDGLTSLRASGKRSDTDSAGRFGVGFAAVLAVTDEPAVLCRDGGITFSAARTRELLDGAAKAEAERRGGKVPVLRLVWPSTDLPAEGFDTEVVLPLRDDAVIEEVRAALDEFDAALLLGLPALSTVDIGGRVIERREVADATDPGGLDTGGMEIDGIRWRVASANGTLPAGLLADRPVEERSRDSWAVLAAVPDGGLVEPQVVHAPTPSQEEFSLPVRLIATFPLSPDRREIPAGPLTTYIAARAGEVIADLIARTAADPSALSLLPRPTFAASSVDAAICAAVSAELGRRNWLPVCGRSERAAASRVLAVDDALVEPLSEVLDGVLPAGWWTHRSAPALAALGVRRLSLADVVEAIAAVDRPPTWWRRLYGGLSGVPLKDFDALASLRVPLADDTTVTGPRDVLLPDEGLPAAAVAALGLRVVHPDAAHPLLERLGARRATAATVLEDPRVRALIEESLDSDDPGAVADAVLALLSTVDSGSASLGDLALLASDGEWWAANELLIPGSPLARAVVTDAPFGVVDGSLIERWGVEVLERAGVLNTFPVLDEEDVDLADVDDFALDGAEEWMELLDPAVIRIERFRAVRDLEWVDSWEVALPMLAAKREVLQAPCVGVRTDGSRVDLLPYSRWWLSTHPVLSGRRPGDFRTSDANDLAGLYDEASTVDSSVAALLGCRTGLDDVLRDPDAARDLVARLGDPARAVAEEVLGSIYARLAAALVSYDVEPPDRIRVAPDRVVPRESAAVLDAPWMLDRLGDRAGVLGGDDPVAVAELLDMPLLSEL
jgi:hypothetical protein